MLKYYDDNVQLPASSELQLVFSVGEFLKSQGYKIRFEISNMGQSIDLVGIKNRWITAVEAKLNNWRRALVQCRAHESVADYIVIALAQKSVSSELDEELKANGWGLLLYNSVKDEWVWRVKPVRNQKIWKPQRKRFVESMKKVSYVS